MAALNKTITYQHLALVIGYLIILKPTSIVFTKVLTPLTKELNEEASKTG